MRKKFSVADRLKSFVYAWAGIKKVFYTEHNMWIHLIAAIAAIAMGFLCRINRMEWIVLVVVIGMVWMAELFNTAIEAMMDIVSTEQHPQIKLVKDIAAGAVLLAAIAAVIVGCFIFIPKLI